jgi:AcrR family transcriptional regulator
MSQCGLALNPIWAFMKQRGRPKLEELPTRQSILAAACCLFREKGFKKTSVEEMCQRAGVSKMSFYRSFKDKTDLFITIFTPIFKEQLVWAEQLLLREMPFRTKLDALLKKRKENLLAPFTSLFLELYPTKNLNLHAFAKADPYPQVETAIFLLDSKRNSLIRNTNVCSESHL